jgi:hypothetical protein
MPLVASRFLENARAAEMEVMRAREMGVASSRSANA